MLFRRICHNKSNLSEYNARKYVSWSWQLVRSQIITWNFIIALGYIFRGFYKLIIEWNKICKGQKTLDLKWWLQKWAKPKLNADKVTVDFYPMESERKQVDMQLYTKRIKPDVSTYIYIKMNGEKTNPNKRQKRPNQRKRSSQRKDIKEILPTTLIKNQNNDKGRLYDTKKQKDYQWNQN